MRSSRDDQLRAGALVIEPDALFGTRSEQLAALTHATRCLRSPRIESLSQPVA